MLSPFLVFHFTNLRYLSKPNLFAVIASPVDNSPNTVLECLSYNIKFIASNVGGIPELVHPQDRERVLFEPNANDLARILRSVLVLHESLAPVTPAVSNQLRTSLWTDLHSSLIPELFALKPLPSKVIAFPCPLSHFSLLTQTQFFFRKLLTRSPYLCKLCARVTFAECWIQFPCNYQKVLLRILVSVWASPKNVTRTSAKLLLDSAHFTLTYIWPKTAWKKWQDGLDSQNFQMTMILSYLLGIQVGYYTRMLYCA